MACQPSLKALNMVVGKSDSSGTNRMRLII
jgi:hypothetical protein